MVKFNLVFLVLTIPNVISSYWRVNPYCETLNNSTTMWSCWNHQNFPTHLYNASTVEKLELQGFGLAPLEKLTSEHLQLYKLPNLVELEVYVYKFQEIEVGAFQNGGKLVNLTLKWNEMKKLDPQVFTDLPNLQKLQIYDSGYAPGLKDLEKLQFLDDFENLEFPKLKNLTELVLLGLRIRSLKPNLFKNLKSLQILDLRSNLLTILDDREVFRPLKNLKFLDLRWNRINYVDPEVFADLQNLETLDLSGNNLEKGFKNWAKFHNPNLIRLNLMDCQLKYIEEEFFQNLGNLKALNLGDNKLSHVSPKMFSLKNLETLILNGNRIEALEPGLFSSLGNLKELDLRFNYLESLDWKDVRPLKKLSELFLNNNQWPCDCQIWYLRNYLKQRNINFDENKQYFSSTCYYFGTKEEPNPILDRKVIKWMEIKPEELNCLAFPNITKLSADKEPKLGENLNLQCEFTGDLPLQVIWMRDDAILKNVTLSEIEPLHNETLKEYNHQLKIADFKEEDAGLYKVVVSNEAGEVEKSEYLDMSKDLSTLHLADNAARNFLNFFQTLLEIMF